MSLVFALLIIIGVLNTCMADERSERRAARRMVRLMRTASHNETVCNPVAVKRKCLVPKRMRCNRVTLPRLSIVRRFIQTTIDAYVPPTTANRLTRTLDLASVCWCGVGLWFVDLNIISFLS
jgi:Flp pilus assembly protein TadB